MEQKLNSQSLRVIMVHSYKGGTGKTAIAVNIAQELSFKYNKRVLLIEQDNLSPTLASNFSITPPHVWNEFYSKNQTLSDLIYLNKPFDIICSKDEEIPINININQFEFHQQHLQRLLIEKRALGTFYDFIIVDTRPGMTFELVNNIIFSDIAVLVTRIDVDTIGKTIEMYERIYSQFESKRIVIVQNQIPKTLETLDESNLDGKLKTKLSAWRYFLSGKCSVAIPLSEEIAFEIFKNKLISRNTLFMKYIDKILNCALPEVITAQ